MLRRSLTREWKNRLGDMSVARLELDDADGAPETSPVVLGEAEGLFGASWGEDDTILFGQERDGIWQVPGGEWVLFTLRRAGAGGWDEAHKPMTNARTRR